jgi:putative transcriptional regulator
MIGQTCRRLLGIRSLVTVCAVGAVFLLPEGGAGLRAAEPAGPEEVPNGVFLVAKRDLADPYFRESVVLVTQHGGRSPVGVIINRPTPLLLRTVFPDNENLRNSEAAVFFGGPVSPQLLVYAFRGKESLAGALTVLPDLHLSFDPAILAELLGRANPTKDLRVYAGYSGWAPGQLQHELARGDWYVVHADADTIFSDQPETIWREMLKRATARQALLPLRRGAAAVN